MIVMQRHQKNCCSSRRALVVFIITTFICAPLHAAEKTLSKDTARQAIMRVAGLQLKKSAVEIKQVSGANAPLEVAGNNKKGFSLQAARRRKLAGRRSARRRPAMGRYRSARARLAVRPHVARHRATRTV